MITQLLKLDPPYNIICGSNKIAKHIATLIVANIKYDDKYRSTEIAGKELFFGGPDMQTYSFPVVEYGDGSPAGDVWRDVEVRECRVIAKAPKDDAFSTRIQSSWFCETLRFLHHDGNGSTQTPITLYEQLKSLHVSVDAMGTRGCPKKVEVELIVNQEDEVIWIESARNDELYYISGAHIVSQKDELLKFEELLRWAGQYIRIFNVQTIFTTKNEVYKEKINEWNKAIEEVVVKHNER